MRSYFLISNSQGCVFVNIIITHRVKLNICGKKNTDRKKRPVFFI